MTNTQWVLSVDVNFRLKKAMAGMEGIPAKTNGHAGSSVVCMQAELRNQLSSFATYHEDLPTPEVVLSLVHSCQLMSQEEWMGFPANVQEFPLDDEVVWPVSRPIKI